MTFEFTFTHELNGKSFEVLMGIRCWHDHYGADVDGRRGIDIIDWEIDGMEAMDEDDNAATENELDKLEEIFNKFYHEKCHQMAVDIME